MRAHRQFRSGWLAVSGEARFIMTGDRDLLDLNPFRGVHIITPADYLKIETA